jgi:hypothetical protein
MASFMDEMGRLLGTSFFRPRMIEEQYGETGGLIDGQEGLEPLIPRLQVLPIFRSLKASLRLRSASATGRKPSVQTY